MKKWETEKEREREREEEELIEAGEREDQTRADVLA